MDNENVSSDVRDDTVAPLEAKIRKVWALDTNGAKITGQSVTLDEAYIDAWNTSKADGKVHVELIDSTPLNFPAAGSTFTVYGLALTDASDNIKIPYELPAPIELQSGQFLQLSANFKLTIAHTPLEAGVA